MGARPREAASAGPTATQTAIWSPPKKRSDMTYPSASMYSAGVSGTNREVAEGRPSADVDELQQSRLVIGVAGGSGSGKTTVVRRIVEALGPDSVSILDHDRYYR